MRYSEKLNGFWEEGYHYYLEIRDNNLTVRDYRRAVALETEISYDSRALERGERTLISLDDNVLSRDYKGGMMTEIREPAYENGKLELLYYYTIMGETLYHLKKVDRGPFDYITIRDDEFIDRLQGEWFNLHSNDNRFTLTVKGNELFLFAPEGERFHVVSYDYAPEKAFIVPENLIDRDFKGITSIEVCGDTLCARMIVMDMNMPLETYVRRDMLGKIEVPEEPMITTPYTVMVDRVPDNMINMGMENIMPIPEQPAKTEPEICKVCGYEYGEDKPKFCPECGSIL